jgi:hypothetical protein
MFKEASTLLRVLLTYLSEERSLQETAAPAAWPARRMWRCSSDCVLDHI